MFFSFVKRGGISDLYSRACFRIAVFVSTLRTHLDEISILWSNFYNYIKFPEPIWDLEYAL